MNDLTGERNVYLAIVHFDAAHADGAAGRLGAQRVPGGDAAGPECPGRNRADPAQGEDAVYVQARGRLVSFALDGCSSERRAQVVEPRSGLRTHGDRLRLWSELTRLVERQFELQSVDSIGLGDGDNAALDAEEAEDCKVLVCLRACAFRRVDDEQEEVDSR